VVLVASAILGDAVMVSIVIPARDSLMDEKIPGSGLSHRVPLYGPFSKTREPVVVASKLNEAFAATVFAREIVLVEVHFTDVHCSEHFSMVVVHLSEFTASLSTLNLAVHVGAGGGRYLAVFISL